MQSTTLSLLTLLFLIGSVRAQKVTKENNVQIIPVPSSIEMINKYFILSEETGISYDKEFQIAGDFLKTYVEEGSTFILKKNEKIIFIRDSSIINLEGYKLYIGPDQIQIRASHPQGAFYAVQSLRQLLPVNFEDGSFNEEAIKIPCVLIEDEPQFSYRGMHLDVSRHMFSVDFIKKYIDALAMLKMNTFHWHLTDDQGWRIEIKKYPKLNKIAAYRNETLIGHYNEQPQQFDGKIYGGYYTQEEIKDVVNHAQNRFISVIPEIEMPGHAQAAIAAYPELGCSGKSIEVATKWGVFEDIYCTKEGTFTFLEDVLDEVLELFPSNYIHIGGDEAPKTSWKNCKVCQAKIKSEGLKDEHELQSYFIKRVEAFLNTKGRQIIGWDEILEGGLAPNATVMSWRGTAGAVEAARSGHHVIMTPTSHCYFDYYQSENDDEPTAIGGFLPLEKVYGFNPIPDELTIEEAEYISGAQGNVWTEYITTDKEVEYMVFPRILALSEVVWSNAKQKNYKGFLSRVENFQKRLETLSINYANHLFEIKGNMISKNKKQFYELSINTEDKEIRFTLNGSDPSPLSKRYEKPIPISSNSSVKAAVFKEEERLGPLFEQTIIYHKGVGKDIDINTEPHKAYSGSGIDGLINGIRGSDKRYGDKEWLGFSGDDLEITINLLQKETISSIETRFHNGRGQWIYAPKKVEISFDGGPFSTFALNQTNDILQLLKLDFDQIKTNTIILRIPNYGIIPDGKQGAGHKAWTFIDEIIIN